MAKDIIGHIKCPYCEFDDAQVKETSKVFQGRAVVMVWCPSPKCQSQYFPRSKEGSDTVRNQMREITGAVKEIELKPISAPAAPAALAAPAEPAALAAPVIIKKTLAEELGI